MTPQALKQTKQKDFIAMEGSEKQVKWAEQIKADALEKVELSLKTEQISQEQYEAIAATANSKDAQWWINRRNDFRNASVATGTLAEATKGYHKFPKGKKASIIFF